jgi:hypothetical protein
MSAEILEVLERFQRKKLTQKPRLDFIEAGFMIFKRIEN